MVPIAFECAAVPAAKFDARFVRDLQEPGDRVVRVLGGADGLVGQHEFCTQWRIFGETIELQIPVRSVRIGAGSGTWGIRASGGI